MSEKNQNQDLKNILISVLNDMELSADSKLNCEEAATEFKVWLKNKGFKGLISIVLNLLVHVYNNLCLKFIRKIERLIHA